MQWAQSAPTTDTATPRPACLFIPHRLMGHGARNTAKVCFHFQTLWFPSVVDADAVLKALAAALSNANETTEVYCCSDNEGPVTMKTCGKPVATSCHDICGQGELTSTLDYSQTHSQASLSLSTIPWLPALATTTATECPAPPALTVPATACPGAPATLGERPSSTGLHSAAFIP